MTSVPCHCISSRRCRSIAHKLHRTSQYFYIRSHPLFSEPARPSHNTVLSIVFASAAQHKNKRNIYSNKSSIQKSLFSNWMNFFAFVCLGDFSVDHTTCHAKKEFFFFFVLLQTLLWLLLWIWTHITCRRDK